MESCQLPLRTWPWDSRSREVCSREKLEGTREPPPAPLRAPRQRPAPLAGLSAGPLCLTAPPFLAPREGTGHAGGHEPWDHGLENVTFKVTQATS